MPVGQYALPAGATKSVTCDRLYLNNLASVCIELTLNMMQSNTVHVTFVCASLMHIYVSKHKHTSQHARMQTTGSRHTRTHTQDVLNNSFTGYFWYPKMSQNIFLYKRLALTKFFMSMALSPNVANVIRQTTKTKQMP